MSLPPPPPLPSSEGALTPEQLRAVSDATVRMKGIRRAVKVARGDAWALVVFGGITVVGSVAMGGVSWVGLVLGVALCVLGGVEFVGAARLGKLQAGAARGLAKNQLVLAGVLILYAVYSLLFPVALPQSVVDSAKELRDMGIDVQELAGLVNRLMYGGLIVVAVLGQGGLAWFYLRREKMVAAYLAETPEWVAQLQRI